MEWRSVVGTVKAVSRLYLRFDSGTDSVLTTTTTVVVVGTIIMTWYVRIE
jgi:hypothetical protein